MPDLENTSEELSPLGLTAEQAAERIGISPNAVKKLHSSGRLKGEKIDNILYLDPALRIKPLTPGVPPSPGPQGKSPGQVFPPGREDPFGSLRSLPDDCVIEIYRLKNGKSYYVVSMAPEEFSLKTVSLNFGGGVYRAVGLSDGQLIAQHGFAIAGPEKHPDDPPPASPDPQQIIIPSTDPQSLQIQQLVGQVQALQQTLMAMAANAPRPQEDGEGRKRWLEEMLLMKQALTSPPPPPPPPQPSPEEGRKRWLEEMLLMKQVFSSDRQPDNLAAISGALMKGVEMAATVSSIGEKEGVGTALIKGMIPTLSEVVGGIAKNLITPPPPAIPPLAPNPPEIRQIPVGGGGDGTPETTGDRPPDSQTGSSGLDLLLPVLRRAARENRDPYPYAAMIASEIPDEAIGPLRAATAEQFSQFAASLDPQLSEYPGWVSELRSALMTELSEEDNGGKP